jgi:hypothetical protein
MASIINASTAGAGGVITTADASGELQIQSAGATVATVTGSGVAVTGALSSSGALSATTGSFSGNVTLGSSVLGTPDGSASLYMCRAWVNFNGTGTVAIRGAGNVSSITDNGTGNYTANFSIAMPDTSYAYPSSASFSGDGAVVSVVTVSTSSLRIITEYVTAFDGTTTPLDAVFVNLAIFR